MSNAEISFDDDKYYDWLNGIAWGLTRMDFEEWLFPSFAKNMELCGWRVDPNNLFEEYDIDHNHFVFGRVVDYGIPTGDVPEFDCSEEDKPLWESIFVNTKIWYQMIQMYFEGKTGDTSLANEIVADIASAGFSEIKYSSYRSLQCYDNCAILNGGWIDDVIEDYCEEADREIWDVTHCFNIFAPAITRLWEQMQRCWEVNSDNQMYIEYLKYEEE